MVAESRPAGIDSHFSCTPHRSSTTGEHRDASFRNGVLEITMDAPKKTERAGRRIEVTDGETRAK
jgi:hypothetical protein